MPTCRNNEDGPPCGELAVASLSIHVQGSTDEYGTIDICLRHLLILMVRNGSGPPAAVDLVERLARCTALEILREEEKEKRS